MVENSKLLEVVQIVEVFRLEVIQIASSRGIKKAVHEDGVVANNVINKQLLPPVLQRAHSEMCLKLISQD
jgi:hypothetical protein